MAGKKKDGKNEAKKGEGKEPVGKEVMLVIEGEPDEGTRCACRMVAVIAMDGRGQIVLPKSLRDRADMKEGDRFCVVSSEADDKVCCISLLKADEIDQTVKDILGPIMKDVVGSGEKPGKKKNQTKAKRKGSK